jgi:hypothetical protein
MSRANKDVVLRMVYENLGITEGDYGTYEENQRYPLEYVLDAVAAADINVMKTLLKSKQYHFEQDYFTVQYMPNATPTTLPSNIEMLNVTFYDFDREERGVEIPWEMFEMFSDYKEPGLVSLFDFQGDNVKEYGGYYSVKDHKLYTIPFGPTQVIQTSPFTDFIMVEDPADATRKAFGSNEHGMSNSQQVILKSTGSLPVGYYTNTVYYVTQATLNTFKLSLTSGGNTLPVPGTGSGQYAKILGSPGIGYFKYISLEHPGTLADADDLDLTSPQSFEEAIAFLASANLLMKRANNPPQASYYLQQYQAMMGLYMSPSSNQSRVIDQ